MGYIYILTSPKGKSYIGQTIRPIQIRLEEHQKSKGGRGVSGAIKKHGWENFEKDWYYCPDEELNKHEELMVEVLGTLTPNGYNLREGGGNRGKASEETRQKNSEATKGENNPMYGKKHSDEAKQKNRESNIGKKQSEETKQKKREAMSGEKNHNYGKPMSVETKQKLKEVNLGKTHSSETRKKQRKVKLGENNCSSKRVYQYDLDGTFINSFGSSGEAGRHLEKDGSFIRRCARGERKSRIAYDFKWSYTLSIFM